MNSLVVDFLTRSGCHLCHESLPKVEAAARRARVRVRTVDIDDDDVLVSVYGLRIPVILAPDGAVLWEGPVERVGDLTVALKNWRRRGTRRPRLLRRR